MDDNGLAEKHRAGLAKCNPSFSVVVPVINEAERINGLIEHLGSLDLSESIEIIVVDGDPAGPTIKAVADDDVIVALSDKGRARQMNKGAQLARGEVIMFLHADTQLPPNALRAARSVLADDDCVGGAFNLGVDTKNILIHGIAAISNFRNRLHRVPFGDQAIFLRRDYFNDIGGFRDIPFMEDIEMMRRIRKRGDRIRILPEQVTSSARRWEKEGVVFCALRNAFVLALFGLGVSPQRLARFYRSH
jgi:rSAM/selenodomain-associated transferase 2